MNVYLPATFYRPQLFLRKAQYPCQPILLCLFGQPGHLGVGRISNTVVGTGPDMQFALDTDGTNG